MLKNIDPVLPPPPPPSEIEKRNPKTITLTSSVGSGVVIYTVPAGRVFRGRIFSNSTSTSVVSLNGVDVGPVNHGGGTNVPQAGATLERLLVAGDTITCTSTSTVYVQGVEYDA